MPDPLDIIMSLRRVTVDDAKRELSALLRAEENAEAEAEAAEALINEETRAATDLYATDAAVEAFAAWLPVGRSNAAAARLEYEQRHAEVALARAALCVARAAAEAAQNLLVRRAAEQRHQAEMDEIASARRNQS